MGASVVTKPTVEPLTLAEVRSHLRIDGVESDASLAAYILASRQYAENVLRRALITQTHDFTLDYDWPLYGREPRIWLPLQPVQSVTSVTYIDEDGATQTLTSSPAQYVVHGIGADSYAFIAPAYGVSWPTVRRQPEAITVRYVVGYGDHSGDVPEPIRAALLFHVELLHDRDPAAQRIIEDTRDALMDPYRVVRVG